MNKLRIAACGVFLAAVALFGGSAATFAETAAAQGTADVVDVGNTICPISGDKASKKVSFVYEGKRYHFCCSNCVKEFKKDPEKYIANMERGK